jgi:hypothetical protein
VLGKKRVKGKNKMKKKAKEYINPYLGGVLLGLVLFIAYFLTGAGLGASGAVLRVDTALVDVVASEHIDKVGYFAKIAGGDLNPLKSGAVFMLLGTLIGGFVSGFFNNRLKVETKKGSQISKKQRWFFAFLGGGIMGYGARLARGCTSGQALSGGAVLSVGSWAFMFSIFIGGYILAYSVRKLWIDRGE